MNLDPAPRQSKLVFLAIDAGLLVTAFIIVYFAKNPYAPLPFVGAVLCVVLAAIIGLVPYLVDYAADSAEYVQSERGRVTEQVQRLHAASESLARAAAQIKAVEEAVHKTAHAAENLPYRMQEKLAEFNEALAEKENEEREALERELDELRAAHAGNLKAVTEKIAKATAELSALATGSHQQLATAQETSRKLHEQLQATLAQLDTRLAALATAVASVPRVAVAAPVALPAPSEVAPATPAPTVPEPVQPVIESVTLSEAPVTEELKPKKPRAPRKPKPEETTPATTTEATPPAEETDAEAAASAGDEIPAPSEETESASKAEASASSDGATRLLVTAYIGIGNKLFIRGEGPGLSWEKGIPMQFVSIGKWGWATHDATAPVKCKLYKNDEAAALSGEVTLEPGKHVEATALF